MDIHRRNFTWTQWCVFWNIYVYTNMRMYAITNNEKKRT